MGYNLLPGMRVTELKSYKDNRGSFIQTFVDDGVKEEYIQDNQSISKKNVLRGLHFQYPNRQAKLIRVIKGSILDVCVDIKKSNESFLSHVKIELSDKNNLCLFVPDHYAHGFLSLEEDTIVSYKCTNYYESFEQFGIIWNDESLNIDWQVSCNDVILSDKDAKLPRVLDALGGKMV